MLIFGVGTKRGVRNNGKQDLADLAYRIVCGRYVKVPPTSRLRVREDLRLGSLTPTMGPYSDTWDMA
jgi:hypothetical protein